MPTWISLSDNSFVGKAGIFRADSKAAANELAQSALNDFVQNAFAGFTLACNGVLPLLFPSDYSPVNGLEIVHFHDGYGVGFDALVPGWKQQPGSYPPTSLVNAVWPVKAAGGSGNPWWDGVFNVYPTLPANNANPQQPGSVYMWRQSHIYLDFCRVGRYVNIGGLTGAYETSQTYAWPQSGFPQPLIQFALTVRSVNDIPIWLISVQSEYGGQSGQNIVGCWYKLSGYTPEGTYKLNYGSSPPQSTLADFAEFSSPMIPAYSAWILDPAPELEIMTQVNLILLPKQEASDPPVLGSSNNFVRYLNTDSHGINGTFYLTDGSNNIYSSTDGYNWSVFATITQYLAPTGAMIDINPSLTDIAFGLGLIVAPPKV